MFERFTDRARKVMALANQEALRYNHEYIGSEHILLGLVKEGSGTGAIILKYLDIDLRKVLREVEKLVKTGPTLITMGKLPQTPSAKKVIEYAIEESRIINHAYVGTEHLLLGLIRENDGVAAQVLNNLGLKLEEVRQEVLFLVGSGKDTTNIERSRDSITASGRTNTPALDSFGKDLCQLASNNQLGITIGRQKEIQKLVKILSRHQLHTPLLVGPHGVGRSSIVYGLAQNIVNEEVPFWLMEKRIVEIDLTLIAAGTKNRIRPEERITAIINECKRAKNIILMVDANDFSQLANEDSAYATLILSSMQRGELQLIAKTTDEIFDSANGSMQQLFSFCSTIRVTAPGLKTVKDILFAHREQLEAHHGTQISDEALEYVVEFISTRTDGVPIPQMLIDIIDEACAAANTEILVPPKEIRDISKEIRKLQHQKDQLIREADYEAAANARDEMKKMMEKKENLLAEYKRSIVSVVNPQSIKQAISSITGLSIEKIEDKNAAKIPVERISGITLSRKEYSPIHIREERKFGTKSISEYERLQTESILQSDQVDITPGIGFVLLPHTPEFEEIFDQAIRPAMEKNNLHAVKANDIYIPGAILPQVWRQIRTAEVVVADMSTFNPNVIYELGLCHGLYRCPILLVRDPEKLPFNIRSLRYIEYENTIGGVKKMCEKLTRSIEEFLAATRGPETTW